jgi:polyferredoxin
MKWVQEKICLMTCNNPFDGGSMASELAGALSVEEDQQGVEPPVQSGKKLVCRTGPDHSQAWRRLVQVLFLILNVLIGLQFILFVRYFESGGRSLRVARPPGVEGWLPIAGLMNLRYFLATGQIPFIHPAAMFLLVAFLIISFLFRKAFCSWLCPIGTLSEALWKLGQKVLKRNWSFPRWIDLPLRGLKYLLLIFFIYAIGGMSAGAIEAFLSSPYGLVADLKMLHFFRNLSITTAITIGVLLILSIFLQNFWCRYLCPYGALTGIASLFSPAKIVRNEQRCIDCGKCTRACPALLKVDKLPCVRSAECTGCLECVTVCPAEGALQLSFWRKRRLQAWMMAAGLAIVFFGIVGFAKWNKTWDSIIPASTYEQLIPRLDSLSHP